MQLCRKFRALQKIPPSNIACSTRHCSTRHFSVELTEDVSSSDWHADGVSKNVHSLGLAARSERHTTYKFVDKVQLEVKGGKGGNGCISHLVLSPGKKRPNGGNGGRGGNVYIVADRTLNSLDFQNFHFNADDGKHGGSDGLTGRQGKDVFIKVPCGTIVSEKIAQDLFELLEEEGYEDTEINEKMPAYELNLPTDILLVAEGGKPGTGNGQFGGTSQQRGRSVPTSKLPGSVGEQRTIMLELKLIADVGLVGYPNAGKSTLLDRLSRAKPVIAPYPFTTLHPNVGVVQYSDLERVTMADIPGLIEGAHDNKGLGHDFLRHIERTKVLLYVIDAAGTEDRKPVDDMKHLLNELELYDEVLLTKPALVFANKIDLSVDASDMKKLTALSKKLGLRVLKGSANERVGLGELATELRRLVQDENTRMKHSANLLAAEAAAKAKMVEEDRMAARASSASMATVDIRQEDEQDELKGELVMENTENSGKQELKRGRRKKSSRERGSRGTSPLQ